MIPPVSVINAAKLTPDMEHLYVVDARWPKGLSRSAPGIEKWMRDAAPADGLVIWLQQDHPMRWSTFCEVYWSDLANNPHRWNALREAASRHPVVLVHGDDNERYNPASALAQFIEQQITPTEPSSPHATRILS